MTPVTFPAARPWAEANFAAAELGDRRRTRRLVDTAERLAQQPQGSLPAHFSWNPLRRLSPLQPTRSHAPRGDGHPLPTNADRDGAGLWSGPRASRYDRVELHHPWRLDGDRPRGRWRRSGILAAQQLGDRGRHSATPGLGLPAGDHAHARPRGRDSHRAAAPRPRIATVGTRHPRRRTRTRGDLLGRCRRSRRR